MKFSGTKNVLLPIAFEDLGSGKDRIHPNIKLLEEVNLKEKLSINKKFSPRVIWRFFNPMIPDIAGDYEGINGVIKLFEVLDIITRGSFEYIPVRTITVGNELVMMHVKNRMNTYANQIEIDTILVWRIVNKKIVEVWNIPSVYNDQNPSL
ncbi:hypothetical protein [Maribacter sp. 2210JD10-5]|uniref:hypothetical protein n=1 Tax=Maribacter sp. 2210JD10-5 TaxID=3386272 RepID=UPI0039BCA5FD